MLRSRVIPCLLLQNKGLVKTVKFKDPKYVGDPINAVKIFNEKEVDELIFLDIDASSKELAETLAIAASCSAVHVALYVFVIARALLTVPPASVIHACASESDNELSIDMI